MSATLQPGPSESGETWRIAAVATLAQGLASPWSVVPLPGGGALVSQRDDGRVLELTASGRLRDAGIVPGVVAAGEGGLLGLALHEDADGTSWLYAYHTAAADNRVVRMPLRGSPGGYTLGDATVVFDAIARASNHNGGRIAFGPDGLLYVATGDAGNPSLSQDPASPNGKILRLTPEGSPAPGNPLGSAVLSLGHRNVQGLAWTEDGSLWASEFGQNTWDELNLIEPGGNYGWPIVEGMASDPAFVNPFVTWTPDEASPSGVAAIGMTIFVASLRGERVWTIDVSTGQPIVEPALVGEQGRIRDVVVAPDASLWILTNNTDGRGSPRPEDDLLLRADIVAAASSD